MDPVRQAEVFAAHISSLENFVWPNEPRHAYDHMGALVVDAALQAGVRYSTVVAPRVRRVRSAYPEGTTSSGFQQVMERVGVERVVSWSHHEKLRRVTELTAFFILRGLETVPDVRGWLQAEDRRTELLQVRGVGMKTVDYIALLAGTPAVAVDRHIKRLISDAGIRAASYADIRTIVCGAAETLDVDQGVFDQALWLYASRLGAGGRC